MVSIVIAREQLQNLPSYAQKKVNRLPIKIKEDWVLVDEQFWRQNVGKTILRGLSLASLGVNCSFPTQTEDHSHPPVQVNGYHYVFYVK